MTINIKVVPDSPCPKCGAYWGHPTLDYPNRPKVALEDGIWWWRCYNPVCAVSYYNPETGATE
jgi:hypothetical protein